MIVTARNEKEWNALAGFVRQYAGVAPSSDMRCIGWVTDDAKKLAMVVAFTDFVGKTAQIHVACAPDFHFTPRAMLREVFHYAFVTAERELLIGVLSSLNRPAMRYDLHLGFREAHRLPGMHDHGGDLVLLTMKKADCRYLTGDDHGQVASRAAAA